MIIHHETDRYVSLAFAVALRSFWRHWNAYSRHGRDWRVSDEAIEQLGWLARRMAHEARRAGHV